MGRAEQRVELSRIEQPTRALQLFAKAAGIPTDINAVGADALKRIEQLGQGKVALTREMPTSPTPTQVRAFTRERILLHLAMGTATTAKEFVDKVKAEADRRGIRQIFPQGPQPPNAAERAEIRAAEDLAAAAAAAERGSGARESSEPSSARFGGTGISGSFDGSSRYEEEVRRDRIRQQMGARIRELDWRDKARSRRDGALAGMRTGSEHASTDAFRTPTAPGDWTTGTGIQDVYNTDFGTREDRDLHAEILRLGIMAEDIGRGSLRGGVSREPVATGIKEAAPTPSTGSTSARQEADRQNRDRAQFFAPRSEAAPSAQTGPRDGGGADSIKSRTARVPEVPSRAANAASAAEADSGVAATGGGGGRRASTGATDAGATDASATDAGATPAGATPPVGDDARGATSFVDALPPDPRMLLRESLKRGGVAGGVDVAAAIAASVAPDERSELEQMFADIHYDASVSTMGNIAKLQADVMQAQLEANRDAETAVMDRTDRQLGAYIDGQTYSEWGRPSASQQRLDAAGITAIGAEMADIEDEMKLIRRRIVSADPATRRQAVQEMRLLERDVQFRLESVSMKQQRLVLKELTQDAATLHSQVSRLELQKRMQRGEHTGRPSEEFMREQNKGAGKAARRVFAYSLGLTP